MILFFLELKGQQKQFYDNGILLKIENADSDFTHDIILEKIKTSTEKAYKTGNSLI